MASSAAPASFPYDVSVPVRRSRGDRFLALYGGVLLGYALLDKGFAYLGVSPLYVGELTLALGIGVVSLSRSAGRLFRLPLTWLLLGFMAWGAARTVPYLGEYGVTALRDATLWGYAAFALVVAGLLLAKPGRLRRLVEYRYPRFVSIFLLLMPALWLVARLWGDVLPRWPGTDVAIIDVKAGDFLVHLSGIAAFAVAGLA